MTTDDLTRMCPPPDGFTPWDWADVRRWRTSNPHTGERVTILEFIDGRLAVEAARPQNITCTVFAAGGDLSSTYLRALQAVGMAADPEKEALTREVETLRARIADLEGYLLTPEPETHQRSPDDAPHTDAPFWLPDDL